MIGSAVDTLFRFLKPGEINQWPGDFENLCFGRPELKNVVFSALSLADSAGGFFRGVYPIQSPSFWWGESISLPWQDEYWKVLDDGKTWEQVTIGKEVNRIAHSLNMTAIDNGMDRPWEQATFLSGDLCQSDKLTMQGLAVEAMLAVDGFLLCISKGEFVESMPWLVSANTNIIQCTCQAQKILGSVSENARAAANIRHVENRAMKADIFAWLDANMTVEMSMDKATDQMMEAKLVPVTSRTIRGWVGEWKKLRPARIR